MEKIKPTYIGPTVAPLLNLVQWMTQEWVTEGSNWSDFVASWPMDLIWTASLAFLLGLLLQDGFNKDSPIRKRIKACTSSFVISDVIPKSITDCDYENLIVVAKIRFIKNVQNVKITLRAYGDIDIKHSYKIFVLETRTIQSVSKDETIEFNLATFPVSAPKGQPIGHPCWGSRREAADVSSGKPIYGANVVEIEVRSGIAPQKELVFINAMMDRPRGKAFISYGRKPSAIEVILPTGPE